MVTTNLRLRMDLPPSEALIDTHVHMWNLAHPTLTWNWIDTPEDHPIVGNIDSVKSQAFEMMHLEAESRFAGVSQFVHVQAAIGSRDPVDETRWLTEMAQSHPKLGGIVGHVDLGEARAEEQILGHMESDLFRGVRDFAIEPYLSSGITNATFERNLTKLARHDLVLDLDCEFQNMVAAFALAKRHPDLNIVLEHIGFPRRRDAEYFRSWKQGITAISEAPNVVCKLSGLAMTSPQFTYDELRRWVDHCILSFGPDRVLVGSNWPLDRVRGSYDAIMAHTRSLISELAEEYSEQILRTNAQRIYKLGES